jgi:hypothetical protein
MLIVRRSPFTGKIHEMEIAVTQHQLYMWQTGTAIQRAMPNLTADQREFIMTGITPAEWAETFGEDE